MQYHKMKFRQNAVDTISYFTVKMHLYT